MVSRSRVGPCLQCGVDAFNLALVKIRVAWNGEHLPIQGFRVWQVSGALHPICVGRLLMHRHRVMPGACNPGFAQMFRKRFARHTFNDKQMHGMQCAGNG